MTKKEIRQQILKELEDAWEHNPDLTLNTLIIEVMNFSWPTRKGHGRITDSDLLKGLTRYNDVKIYNERRKVYDRT